MPKTASFNYRRSLRALAGMGRIAVAFGFILLSLPACTLLKPSGDYLPSADMLVPGEEITVGRGENIYAVAQKYGVNMREVIVLNDLQPPFTLKPGQRLTLPNKDRYAAPVPKAAPVTHVDKRLVGSSAPAPTTLAGGAVTSVQLDAPAPKPTPAPTASSNYSAVEPMPEDAPAPRTTNFTSQAAAPAKSATQVRELDVKDLNIPSFSAVKPEASTPAPQPTASAEPPAFTWPVKGTIISAFGPKGKGRDNDGINIAAPKGAPVKASEGGMVVYAGNEMKGFGNLVLIRHEGGWVSAYAHLERLVVARDAIVAKGDMIGTVGTTGGVGSPQLHFEVRRDGKPTDPELVLK